VAVRGTSKVPGEQYLQLFRVTIQNVDGVFIAVCGWPGNQDPPVALHEDAIRVIRVRSGGGHGFTVEEIVSGDYGSVGVLTKPVVGKRSLIVPAGIGHSLPHV